jgi:hypothetical protein
LDRLEIFIRTSPSLPSAATEGDAARERTVVMARERKSMVATNNVPSDETSDRALQKFFLLVVLCGLLEERRI